MAHNRNWSNRLDLIGEILAAVVLIAALLFIGYVFVLQTHSPATIPLGDELRFS